MYRVLETGGIRYAAGVRTRDASTVSNSIAVVDVNAGISGDCRPQCRRINRPIMNDVGTASFSGGGVDNRLIISSQLLVLGRNQALE